MADMNPNAILPNAVHRSGPTATRSASEPPRDDMVMVRDPVRDVVESVPVAEAVKPLRGEKEPLPEANSVDPEQVLKPGEIDPSPAAVEPMSEGTAEGEDSEREAELVIDFDGGAYGNPNTIPPDTHGAPGLDRVVTTLNNRVTYLERDGTFDQDMTLDAFWDVFGDPIDTFDPKLFLDELTGRYIAVFCGNARLPDSSVLVAVSHTDDPKGDWSFGRIAVDSATMGDVWLDYPSVGFTEDKITLCLNLFTNSSPSSFEGIALFVIDKVAFMDPPHDFVFEQFIVVDQGGTLCPAIAVDRGVSEQYLVSNWTGNFQGKGFLALFRITGTVAGGDTAFERVGFLEIDRTWSGSQGDFAPQRDSSDKINTGDTRMQWVVQRNGRLILAHTVFVPADNPSRAAVQWAEVSLDGTPAVTDHGLIGGPDDERYYAYPSLAVNGQGDTLIGMAAFANDIFASGAYTFRPAGGAFQAPQLYAPGTNTYHLTFSGTRNRWGDYSATHVDPADGRSFWTVQEYAGPDPDRWTVRWGCIGVPAAFTS